MTTKICLDDSRIFQNSGVTLTFNGNNLISDCGTLKYQNDQSNAFTARSLVDKGIEST